VSATPSDAGLVAQYSMDKTMDKRERGPAARNATGKHLIKCSFNSPGTRPANQLDSGSSAELKSQIKRGFHNPHSVEPRPIELHAIHGINDTNT
jgi:hypothetical protein